MSHAGRSRELESTVYRSIAGLEEPRRAPLLVRLFTEPQFAARVLRRGLNLPTPMRTEDRRVLEQVIFNYYRAQRDMRSILFVGVQWYTRHYERSFFPGRNFWTIEPDGSIRKHGSRQHVVAPLERLDEFFPEGYFDLIICNGVYGYGLNTSQQCETAFAHCHTRLREQGELVLGWDDIPTSTPVLLESIASLGLFGRRVFPPLDSARYLTNTPYRHTYDFYIREPK